MDVALIITLTDLRLCLFEDTSNCFSAFCPRSGEDKYRSVQVENWASLWRGIARTYLFYRTDEKCPLWCSGFWSRREVQSFQLYPPAPLTLPHQGLLKSTLREEAVFNLGQIWSHDCGELALGLGHSGNTSHMTWSMGGPWKLILCFFTPHPQTTQPAQVLVFQSQQSFKGLNPTQRPFFMLWFSAH